MTNVFETATRKKVRFDTSKGSLTVEQLWDLPLTSAKGLSLDGVGRQIVAELSALDQGSLVETAPSAEKAELTLRLGLIKRVIEVKQAENAANRERIAKAAERDKVLAALAARENADLANQSADDLRKKLAELEGV